MIQHLVNSAVSSDLGKGEDPQHYETKMAHGRVSNQLFEIGLHQRNQRTVDNADNGQRVDSGSVVPRLLREQANVKAQQAISARLEQHPCQQD